MKVSLKKLSEFFGENIPKIIQRNLDKIVGATEKEVQELSIYLPKEVFVDDKEFAKEKKDYDKIAPIVNALLKTLAYFKCPDEVSFRIAYVFLDKLLENWDMTL